MRHPYEKFIRLELLTLAAAVIIGLIAIIQGYLLIVFFCLFLVAISMIFEGLIAMNTFHTTEGLKQFTKAAILLLLTFILFFKL
ncbi:hypothetical protein [Virgibacillus siamensis]|uniref:hypothetical protein n=1 Tax=Virgibacillus siamensis TaxID=480071 RepID=UPI000985D24F|nr:hypothetical protein [Virgibacillus siamensis]